MTDGRSGATDRRNISNDYVSLLCNYNGTLLAGFSVRAIIVSNVNERRWVCNIAGVSQLICGFISMWLN